MTLSQHRISVLSTKEGKIVSALLILVAVLTCLDVVEDALEGASLFHIVPEIAVVTVTAWLAIVLFFRFARGKEAAMAHVRQEAESAKQVAFQWQEKAQELSKGITDTISAQLGSWGLTEAEHEVCFLLLKGLSLAEISEIRQTSERTIRHQASAIYDKSGLSGRAQLSAFFLEDLFSK